MILSALLFPVVAFAATLQDVANVGYATMNGGTSGGKGGKVVNVSSFAALKSAVEGNAPAIIVVSGKIVQEGMVKVGSNKSIIGKNGQAELVGLGLTIKGQKNIIIRNLKISKVKASAGDAISIQKTTNVWIDHVDVSSDLSHDKDFYDGLIDLTHAVDYTTISNSYIHDHHKGSLLGHSDNNGKEDTGHLRTTFTGNLWKNVKSRGPSLRFGTAHIFDNVYLNMPQAINVRKGAQVLVENNFFEGSKEPLYSVDKTGGAVQRGNVFGANAKAASTVAGKLSSVPYKYQLSPAGGLSGKVQKSAGATLSFGGGR